LPKGFFNQVPIKQVSTFPCRIDDVKNQFLFSLIERTLPRSQCHRPLPWFLGRLQTPCGHSEPWICAPPVHRFVSAWIACYVCIPGVTPLDLSSFPLRLSTSLQHPPRDRVRHAAVPSDVPCTQCIAAPPPPTIEVVESPFLSPSAATTILNELEEKNRFPIVFCSRGPAASSDR